MSLPSIFQEQITYQCQNFQFLFVIYMFMNVFTVMYKKRFL